jgi:AraC-like DNA-binding protein
MEITKILTILCIALFGLLGIFLMASKRKRSQANRILGIFFLFWGLNFLDGYLLLDGFYLKFPSLAFWEEPLAFLYGPIIYFYCRALVGISPIWKPLHLMHLLPTVSLQIVLIQVYHLQPVTTKIEIVQKVITLEPVPQSFWVALLIFLHILSYLFFSSQLITQYTRIVEDNYSTINLSWLKNTLRSLAFIVLLSMTVSVIQYYGQSLLFEIGLMVLMASLLVFISSILFRVFEDPRLFQLEVKSDKYSGSNLSQIQKQEIAQKILDALEQHKIHLNSQTTIADLSELIQVHPRQVSQVINEQFNQNFFEFINTHRIREAQKLMTSSQDPKLTILEVMYQVGFNSKSSFNTQFKKITGKTPSTYRKEQK